MSRAKYVHYYLLGFNIFIHSFIVAFMIPTMVCLKKPLPLIQNKGKKDHRNAKSHLPAGY